MHDFMNKDITRDFIRSKRPCAAGYRWYLKREETLSGYQRLLDDLVQEGRVDDACWLLDQLGPTETCSRWTACTPMRWCLPARWCATARWRWAR